MSVKDKIKEKNLLLTFEELLAKAQSLPKKPGCYLMYNVLEEVIYVGKSSSLQKRVLSYFKKNVTHLKTRKLISHITYFDFILTETNAESYILENNLIKKHRPKYNIRLKDDRSYPYIQIDYNERFPRLEFIRRPKKRKKKSLFGPFPPGSNIRELIQNLNKSFALRDCSLFDFKQRKTPCLLFQLHQCEAPCVKEVSLEDYHQKINLVIDFLKGGKKSFNTLKYLQKKMSSYSSLQHFERAATIRDSLIFLESFLQTSYRQSVELKHSKNLDVISYYHQEQKLEVCFYFIRFGNIIGHKSITCCLRDIEINHLDIEKVIISCLINYYSSSLLPEGIVLPLSLQYQKILKEALLKIQEVDNLKIYKETSIYKNLLKMVKEKAKENFRMRKEEDERVGSALAKLKGLLNLEENPRVIECYDIAIWQGKSPTAAQVVFIEGKAEKKEYRHYHLQEREEGNNDFAMMEEVLTRRLKYGKFPDVFVVDGGKGQISAFDKVLQREQIDIPIVGIAKKRTQLNQEERLFISKRKEPFLLKDHLELYKMMVKMRDEAHRFSRRLHHKEEKKRIFLQK